MYSRIYYRPFKCRTGIFLDPYHVPSYIILFGCVAAMVVEGPSNQLIVNTPQGLDVTVKLKSLEQSLLCH